MLIGRQNLNIEEKSTDIWLLGKKEKEARLEFNALSEEDFIMEIELTANRSDCLSIIGIARETAALLNKDLKLTKPSVAATIMEDPDISIEEKTLCPRYSARILRDVEIKESPDWIKRKLELCGVRPINNIVDATNYVLLEYGQPMHAFDFDKLSGGRIVVRKAGVNESFKTLDGSVHLLNDDMLMIADGEKAVALAGIMGGENSEINPSTKNILLESAYFEPLGIRKTSKILGIKTEASYRFERTADWGVTTTALDRAAEIIMMHVHRL